jgi:hypothetical protein
MMFSKLTDLMMAREVAPAAGRRMLWDSIVTGLGLRVGARSKT